MKWRSLFTHKKGKLYWKASKGNRKAGSEAGTNHGDGYKTVRLDGKAYFVHKIVKAITTGRSTTKEIDHKNRNRSDNRPSNLRAVSRSKNNKNRRFK